MAELSFKNQTVVVTGTGCGIGHEKVADAIAASICAAGGKAVANYDSIEDGDRIIEAAVSSFGGVHVLINNAAIISTGNFDTLTDEEWRDMLEVHLRGAFKCTKAAWPHFKRQSYGRILNTAALNGSLDTAESATFSTATLAHLGLAETLAREGAKHNITANVLAPFEVNRLGDASLLSGKFNRLNIGVAIASIGFLSHKSSNETGSMFEVRGTLVTKMRWERSKGLSLKPDIETLTPGVILQRWHDVNDFSQPSYPQGTADMDSIFNKSKTLRPNAQGVPVSLTNKVALITGAASGLGRSYALLFARLGASVVVNDLASPDAVVQEIRNNNGSAVGIAASVEDGTVIVKAAIDAYGRLDIVVNNAGFVRDKSFANMTDDLWNSIIGVHLNGAYQITKAAWPYFLRQNYGRIINTTSTSGIYGSFGQANYAAAKLGIVGLSEALAREGAQNNIYVNTIAPAASTAALAAALSSAPMDIKPDYVAPLVALLCSNDVPDMPTGRLYEAGAGWFARTRWQRSLGHDFGELRGGKPSNEITPEAMLEAWQDVVDFDTTRSVTRHGQATYARILRDSVSRTNIPSTRTGEGSGQDLLSNIEKAKTASNEGTRFAFDNRDVILYNISIGAKRTHLPLIYESSPGFQALPTFGVIPFAGTKIPYDVSTILLNYSPTSYLHGEQYLEIHKYPLPIYGNFTTHAKLINVVDKGKDAIVVTGFTTSDTNTGEKIFYNESSLFFRGAGGFGSSSQTTLSEKGPTTLTYKPPSREPDTVVEERTSDDQAALYRLNGDRNAIHIGPEFSKQAGFETPILHGLCSMGIAGKHVLQRYGTYRTITVRFAGIVLPGQTLRTEMWSLEGSKKVVFQVKVVETGGLCISHAGVELVKSTESRL